MFPHRDTPPPSDSGYVTVREFVQFEKRVDDRLASIERHLAGGLKAVGDSFREFKKSIVDELGLLRSAVHTVEEREERARFFGARAIAFFRMVGPIAFSVALGAGATFLFQYLTHPHT